MGAAATVEEPIEGQKELDPQFKDGPVGRLEKKAHAKELEVERLEEEGDTEGADIARVEADALREEAADLERKLGDESSKAQDLKNGEGGEPVGEMPAGRPEDPPEPLAEDIIVAGLVIKPIDVGGKKPTAGTLKLTGGSVKLMNGTFFKKGTVIHFSGTAIVNDVGAKDTHDTATQQVTDATQQHSARITGLTVEVPAATK